MIKHFIIQNNAVVPSIPDTAGISVYSSPTAAEIDMLEADFNIDKHTIASALDPDEVPRIEQEENHYAVIWKRPIKFTANESLKFEVSSMGVFIFKHKLLVILQDDIPLFEHRSFRRISSFSDILLRLLSSSITHFLSHLKVIDELSNEIKRKVNTSMENKYLLQMFDLSESLVYYLNAITANGTVLEKLRNNVRKLNFSPDEIDVLDDVHIDNTQCFKQAEIFSSVLTGLMDARGAVVNNNVNTLLRRLTIINTIFLPLNLLASVGGMSEYTAWTVKMPWQISYALFMVGMVFVGLTTFLVINPTILKKSSV